MRDAASVRAINLLVGRMQKKLRSTILLLGYVLCAVFGVVHAEDERWRFLVVTKENIRLEYDTNTYNSDRESVGTWIRTPKGGAFQQMIGVRVQCRGNVTIHHERNYAPDGRVLDSSDRIRDVVVEPGSSWELIRDALCSKRPGWQRILGK